MWNDEEIASLLDIWGEDTIQRQLCGAVRNMVAFTAIAEEMVKRGYDRDVKQCREKIKAFKKKYKETVDKLRKRGVGFDSDDSLEGENIHVNFKWFMDMHRVMRRSAIYSQPSITTRY